MYRIKKFQDWLSESAQINKTSIDNTGGYIYSPVAEEENESNYMFFSNLRKIKDFADGLLSMDKSKIDEILNNGHDWANDHITSAKTNVEQVFGFFKDELKTAVTESAHQTADLHRQFDMSPTWWTAWRMENEKEKGLKIDKDSFSKTYKVADKDDKVLFIFDYRRNKIFTNEAPDYFTLKDEISSEEMQKIDKKAEDIQDDLAGVDSEKVKKDKAGMSAKSKETPKEEEAEGELKTDTEEE